jgi:abhydrolase domain-containing protein 6
MMSDERVNEPRETTIDLDGEPIRVWRKGSGPKIGYFAGWGGLPRWTTFLEELSKHRTVIAPSLPGFPGGGRAHLALDTHLDWVVATRRIFVAAGLEGCDLIGASVGGGLAAEIAALWPTGPRRLVLISPLGLYDEADPPADMFARRADEYPAFLCTNPDRWREHVASPSEQDIEWQIEQSRAAEATARLLWPIANTHLDKRAPLISQRTLVLRGEGDRILPASYSAKWAKAIPGGAQVGVIAGAGHLADLDQPTEVAREILAFTE